jgi:hypothetical protein
MIERAITVAASQLELGQTQQRILSLWSQGIVHHYVLVIALGIRGVGCQRRTPE